MSTEEFEWPPLAGYPCTKGRVANEADVNAGRAAFVLEGVGEPLDVAVPQYAWHIDDETGDRTPCIVIQAEGTQGHELLGCRILPDEQIMAGLLHEFELLGDAPPESE